MANVKTYSNYPLTVNFLEFSRALQKIKGMTEEQHLEIYAKVKELMWMDSMVIVSKHLNLLDDDIGQLGDCLSTSQSYWIALVESALSTAEHAYSGKQSWDHFQTFKVPKQKRPVAAVKICLRMTV